MPRRRVRPTALQDSMLYLADSPQIAKRIVDVLSRHRAEYCYRANGSEVHIQYPSVMPKHFIARWSEFIAGVLCADQMPVSVVAISEPIKNASTEPLPRSILPSAPSVMPEISDPIPAPPWTPRRWTSRIGASHPPAHYWQENPDGTTTYFHELERRGRPGRFSVVQAERAAETPVGELVLYRGPQIIFQPEIADPIPTPFSRRRRLLRSRSHGESTGEEPS